MEPGHGPSSKVNDIVAPCPRGTRTSWPWKCPIQTSAAELEGAGVGVGGVIAGDDGCALGALRPGVLVGPGATTGGGTVPHPASTMRRRAAPAASRREEGRRDDGRTPSILVRARCRPGCHAVASGRIVGGRGPRLR